MDTTFHCYFFIRKPKDYVSGTVPIYLRVTVNGQRTEISTGRKWLPGEWIQDVGRASGSKAKELNTYLEAIQARLYDAHRQLLIIGDPITAETLKNKYLGREPKARWLIQIFEEHNKQVEALLNIEFAPATFKRYQTSLNHVKDFLLWKYKVSDIDIRKVDHAFIMDFEFYLRAECKCNNNSAVKYIKNFGKIIRICLSNGWLLKNPFAFYKSKIREVDRPFLNEAEIMAIAEKNFRIERLNQVRDIFLFSCYTGLAYIDVKNLNHTNIRIGIDGNKWIYTHRQKTDTSSNIPLMPAALEILEKYEYYPPCVNKDQLLPVLSNQKMNAYLKEIADCCEISKELTFHAARHTFATTVTLNNDVPIESVSKMLGHKNLGTTQHYARILDKKVSNDMNQLKQKLMLKEEKQKTAE